jgi:hypothetical protein
MIEDISEPKLTVESGISNFMHLIPRLGTRMSFGEIAGKIREVYSLDAPQTKAVVDALESFPEGFIRRGSSLQAWRVNYGES